MFVANIVCHKKQRSRASTFTVATPWPLRPSTDAFPEDPPKKNISKTKEEESKKDEESKEESSEEEKEMEWRELTRLEKKMFGTWRFVSY